MKYHFGFKLAAFLLAALMLVLLVASGLSIAFISGEGLYIQSMDVWMSRHLESQANNLANHLLRRYCAITLGELNRQQLGFADLDYTNADLSNWYGLTPGSWDYEIYDLNGNLAEANTSSNLDNDAVAYDLYLTTDYPVHATLEESWVIEYTSDWLYRDYYCTETEEHFLYYYTSPTYQVNLRILPSAMDTYGTLPPSVVETFFSMRYLVIAVLCISLVVFILLAIYLCIASGRTPAEPEPRLRGLCRLPLDLSLAVTAVGDILLCVLTVYMLEDLFIVQADTLDVGVLALAALAVFAAALLLVGYLCIAAAQFKMPGGLWWRRSVIGFALKYLVKFLRFCLRGLQTCYRGLRALLRLLPLTWQWLLTAAAMVLLPLFCLFLASRPYYPIRYLFALWFVGACVADVAMVCYGAYAFGTLMKGAKAMAAGDLQAKVPTKYLFGAFRDFADRLNTLADAVKVAANKQMQSERMKTELITNVSHDIKTPLTSLINYVDLLQAPHTPEEGQQYLEVLARQSARMKKLIDDLMDMSKASSGNLPVAITTLDMTETITQALGEFSDKLAAAKLTPVFNPTGPLLVQADGRHTWRVLSNLLSNVVKYAMPGTRVYLDMTVLGSCVQVSVKNISAEPLNVSAEELTERFVRGDASRNTEGSGLGLNIAQSLMELQHGTLSLLIDGDLFKVTLTFPGTLNNG